MISLHCITHAVMVAIIASLVRKYIQLQFHCDDLEVSLQVCESARAEVTDRNFEKTADLDECKNNLNLDHKLMLKHMEGVTDEPSEYLVNRHFDQDDEIADSFTVPEGDKSVNEMYHRAGEPLGSVSNRHKNRMDHQTDEPSAVVRDKDVDHPGMSSSVLSTSVWCYGKNRSERVCHFHNLCYYSNHKDFVFVHGADSVKEGLEGNVDIVDLSSVEGHNKFSFSFVDVLSEKFHNVTVQWVNETSLIFSRFKPDNLMHVLHDDILPLHHTVRWITFLTGQPLSSLDVQFVFMDDWEESEFDSLYETLTDHVPIHTLDLDNSDQVVCFSNSFVGIRKTTTWYQYGFVEPQGPKPHLEVTSKHIHDTVQHLLTHLSSEANTEYSGQYLVLLSRKQNRLILNEAELMVTLVQESKIKVVSISFETHAVNDMIHITRGSRGIIGMHGSLMALSLFLKPGSIIIELFPFAINPLNYTPYKSLGMIKGMHLVYKAWVNTNKENTVAHPEYVSEYGGIQHLPDSDQELIKSQTEVPQHLCCTDPSWLFHIYQDTIVSAPDISALVQTAIAEASNVGNSTLSMLDNSNLFPGPVNNVACERVDSEVGLSLKLTWEQPWNIPYLSFVDLKYEVWLQTVNANDDIVSFMLGNKTMHVLSRPIEPNYTYHVWVRCIIDELITGQFRSVLDC